MVVGKVSQYQYNRSEELGGAGTMMEETLGRWGSWSPSYEDEEDGRTMPTQPGTGQVEASCVREEWNQCSIPIRHDMEFVGLRAPTAAARFWKDDEDLVVSVGRRANGSCAV